MKLERLKVEKYLENSQNIVGLELIIFGSDLKSIYTSFGNGYLRAVDNDNNPDNDYVFGFLPLDDMEDLDFLSSLNSSSLIVPKVFRFNAFKEVEMLYKNRSMARAIMNADSFNIKKFNELLREWLENPEVFGYYNFLSKNCIINVTSILRNIGFEGIGGGFIPSLYDDFLTGTSLFYFKYIFSEKPYDNINVPFELYKPCFNNDCVKEQNNKERVVFSREQQQEISDLRKSQKRAFNHFKKVKRKRNNKMTVIKNTILKKIMNALFPKDI